MVTKSQIKNIVAASWKDAAVNAAGVIFSLGVAAMGAPIVLCLFAELIGSLIIRSLLKGRRLDLAIE